MIILAILFFVFILLLVNKNIQTCESYNQVEEDAINNRLRILKYREKSSEKIIKFIKLMGIQPNGTCILQTPLLSGCPIGSNYPVSKMTVDPVKDPLKWIIQFATEFPYYDMSSGPDILFIPFEPKDTVGHNDTYNQLWISLSVHKDNNGFYPSIISGFNADITSDKQAEEEFGPNWIYEDDGCEYSLYPFGSYINKDDLTQTIMMGFNSILGSDNPAYINTDGIIIIGYNIFSSNELCNYGCGVELVNTGLGIFSFSQLREKLPKM